LRARSFVGPALVGAALCLLYSLAVVLVAKDPFVLVTLGDRFAPPELRDRLYSASGYDGQFTFYLARYGLESEPYLDVPAYRAQRILLPVTARVLWRGDPAGLVWVLLLLNVSGVAIGTWFLDGLLRRRFASRWFALGVVLSLGMLGGARMTTTEPFAFGLALAGLDFTDRGRWRAAGVAFALAALARETTVLFPAACALALWTQGGRRRAGPAGLVLVPACVAFLVWQLVLYGTYGAFGVGSGGAHATGFELVPLWGYVGPIVRLLRAGDVASAAVVAVLMGAFVLFPVFWALLRLLRPRSGSGSWPIAHWLLLLHGATILFIPASTFTEPLGMFRFIVGFQVALVLYAAEAQLVHALKYSLLWASTSCVVLAVDLHTVFR
jgi:hypothetical protein